MGWTFYIGGAQDISPLVSLGLQGLGKSCNLTQFDFEKLDVSMRCVFQEQKPLKGGGHNWVTFKASLNKLGHEFMGIEHRV